MSKNDERNKPVEMRVDRLRKRIDAAQTETQWRGVFHAILDLVQDAAKGETR